MARNLNFSLNGAEYTASPVKVDRSKLYGWNEIIALDDRGNPCKTAYTDETGTLVIQKGGLGLGILSPDNRWVDRSALKAMTLDGKEAVLVTSSFAGSIPLERTVSPEEYLSHSITAVYQLDGADIAFIEALGDKIYTFEYSYRDSYEGSPAFLIPSGGALFLLIGYASEFEMLSLEEMGSVEEAGEEDAEEESDEIDFSMGM
jgi:hypothetical protein